MKCKNKLITIFLLVSLLFGPYLSLAPAFFSIFSGANASGSIPPMFSPYLNSKTAGSDTMDPVTGDGLGLITVDELATNSSSGTGLLSTGLIPTSVEPGWTGSSVSVSLSNIVEDKNWVDNSPMTGSPPSNWVSNSWGTDTNDLTLGFTGSETSITFEGLSGSISNAETTPASTVNWNPITGDPPTNDQRPAEQFGNIWNEQDPGVGGSSLDDFPDADAVDYSAGYSGDALAGTGDHTFNEHGLPGAFAFVCWYEDPNQDPSIIWEQAMAFPNADVIITGTSLVAQFAVNVEQSWGGAAGIALEANDYVYFFVQVASPTRSRNVTIADYFWFGTDAETALQDMTYRSNAEIINAIDQVRVDENFLLQIGIYMHANDDQSSDHDWFLEDSDDDRDLDDLPENTQGGCWIRNINLQINYESKVDTDTYANWNQTTGNSFAGRDFAVQDATFSFDYYMSSALTESPNTRLSVLVNNEEFLAAWSFLETAPGTWTTIQFNIQDAITAGTLDNPFDVELRVTVPETFSLSGDKILYIDNVFLNITTKIDPDDGSILMVLEDVPQTWQELVTNGGAVDDGTGTATHIAVFPAGAHDFTFDFNGASTTQATYSLDLDYIKLNQLRTSLATYEYTAPSTYDSSKVLWNVTHSLALSNNLVDYEFNVTVPNDWAAYTVIRPGTIPETFSLANNITSIFTIYDEPDPSTTNTTVEFFDAFAQEKSGNWYVLFQSPNYVQSIQSQIGPTWTASSIFNPTNDSRINVVLLNDTAHSWLTGMSRRSIYLIKNETDQDVEIHQDTQIDNPVNDANWNVTWTTGNDAGRYRIEYLWNDSTGVGNSITKIGFANVSIENWHLTNITASFEAVDPSLMWGGKFLQPQFLRFLGKYQRAIDGENVTNGMMWLNYTTSSGSAQNYTLFDEIDTGNYSIYFSTLNLENGDQDVQLIFQKKYFEPQIYSFNIEQAIDVVLDVEAPIDVREDARYAEVYYANGYNISLRLRNRYENLDPITNASAVTVSIEDYDTLWTDTFTYNATDPIGNHWYQTIDTDQGRDELHYNVTVQIDYSDGINYENIQFNVTLKITWEETLIWYDTVPVAPIQTNAKIVIFARNQTDNLFLVGAAVTVQNQTDQTDYTYGTDYVVAEDPVSESYNVTIMSENETRWPGGTHFLEIFVEKASHYNHSLVIPLTIRNITTAATYDPPGLRTFTEELNVTFYYRNVDAGMEGITGANLTLTSQKHENTNDVFVQGVNYTIHERWAETGLDADKGIYITRFNCTNCSFSPTVYKFNFTLTKANSQPQNLQDVSFSFRETDTMIDVDGSFNKIITIGEYNLTVWYIDVRDSVKISNSTNDLFINYTWYSGVPGIEPYVINNTLMGLTTVFEEDVDGDIRNQFIFNFDTTGFNQSLTYLLSLNASKFNYETSFANVTFSLVQGYSQIGAINPSPTVYNETVVFYVAYSNEQGISQMNESTEVHLYWDDLGTWRELTNQSVGTTPFNWTLEFAESTPDLSTGPEAKITFNTSALDLPTSGFHTLNITANTVLLQEQSILIRVYINPIDAQVFYETPPIVGLGDQVSFHISYKDTFHDLLINDTLTPGPVNITSDLLSAYYNISRDLVQGNYIIDIDTNYYSTPGIYPITIFANWSGNPHYQNASVTVFLNIRPISTEILFIPYGSIPLGWNMVDFLIQFHDLDTDIPVDLTSGGAEVWLAIDFGASVNITDFIGAADPQGYHPISTIDTSSLNIGTHYLNVSISKLDYSTTETNVPIFVRAHDTFLTITRPELVAFGNNVTIDFTFKDLDNDTYVNFTNTNDFQISVFNDTYNWLDTWPNAKVDYASWGYGPTLGSYYVTLNTSWLDGLGDFDFQIDFDYLNVDGRYDNASLNTTVTTREHYTFLTYDPYTTPYYGANLTITLKFYDLDDPDVGLKLITDAANIEFDIFGQSGIDTTAFADKRRFMVNTTTFITTNRLDIHQLKIGLNWTGTEPYYSNNTVNVSIIARAVETYRTVFIGNDTEGPQQTESKTDWPYKKAANFTIYYNNTDNPAEPTVMNSRIEVSGEDEYSSPTTYDVMGWSGSTFEIRSDSVNGVFKIRPNTSVPIQNKAYQFNITLFVSNDPDEPFKNQTFQIVFGVVKPLTTIIYETLPGSNIPWGTNVTVIAEYQNIQAGNDPIPGASVNITVANIIEDGVSVLVKYGHATIDDYLGSVGFSVDTNVSITEFLDGLTPKYNITFDTTWTNNTQWTIWVNANHTDYSPYTIAVSFNIRDVLCSLDQPVGLNLYYIDELPKDGNNNRHFNLSVMLRDLDSSSVITNTSGLEKYSGIEFYYYDAIGGYENQSRWGRYDVIINTTRWFGNFTVFYDSGTQTFNMSFTVKDGMPETFNYIITIRVNGSHMRGPTLADEWASNTHMVTLKLKLHSTNATTNKSELHPVYGEQIVPQVTEFMDTWDPDMTYGEDRNISVFYYDMNSSYYLTMGEANKSGVEDSPYWNVTTDTIFGRASGNETFPADLRRYIYLHGYYHDIGYPQFKNDTYLGVFNFELRTSLMHLVELNEFDVVNGGKNGDGWYNITINLWFTGVGFQREYGLASVMLPIHFVPINTSLSLDNVTLINGSAPVIPPLEPGLLPYIPFGNPGSNTYFTLELNYSYENAGVGYDVNEAIDSADIVTLELLNGSSYIAWQTGRYQYFAATPQQKLRIYTETIHTVDNALFPWNSSGYKDLMIRMNFTRTNYQNLSLVLTVHLMKHRTALIPLDGPPDFDLQYNQTLTYSHTATYLNTTLVYFAYMDLDEGEPIGLAVGRASCDWPGAVITEHPIYFGYYILTLLPNASVSGSPHLFNISIDDPLALSYRNASSASWNLSVQQAPVTALASVFSPVIFQLYDQIYLSVTFYDQATTPNALSGTVTIQIINEATNAPVYPTPKTVAIVGGRLDQYLILSGELGIVLAPGQYRIEITVTPSDTNFQVDTHSVTFTVNPFWFHPISIGLFVAIGAVAAFAVGREVRWVMRPYVEKQIIKTRRSIKKGKEIDSDKVVRDRSELFKEEFKVEWSYLNLKAPEMVSNEIISLARHLSDIKRTRVTTAEAKQLMNQLQKMGLKQADGYLETTLMVPPDARRTVLTVAGLIKEEKPEILKFRELFSEIKGQEFTYDEVEELYAKLRSMKITDADNYLWKVELIPTYDRLRLLEQSGFATQKLRKKVKKAIAPLTVRELKAELKTVIGLSLEGRRDIIEELKNLSFKEQRKRVNEVKTKTYVPRAERKPARRAAAEKPELFPVSKEPTLRPLSLAEIGAELNQIVGLSDEDKKLLKESIAILSPEEQRKTIENLKQQYSDNP